MNYDSYTPLKIIVSWHIKRLINNQVWGPAPCPCWQLPLWGVQRRSSARDRHCFALLSDTQRALPPLLAVSPAALPQPPGEVSRPRCAPAPHCPQPTPGPSAAEEPRNCLQYQGDAVRGRLYRSRHRLDSERLPGRDFTTSQSTLQPDTLQTLRRDLNVKIPF